MAKTQDIPLLTAKEKFGYSLGDFASNLFWMIFIYYGMFFYTDVFGISAAVVGTMFLFTKLWDAVNDPLMGIISDRTNTRWGKYRPYTLWMAVPYGVIGVLAFTTPDFDMTGKITWAVVTYTMMMMVYTAINIPYSALMGVLTPSTTDRTSIATWRFAAAFGGGVFVTLFVLPWVGAFGGNSVETIKITRQEGSIIDIEEQGPGTVQLRVKLSANKPDDSQDAAWLRWINSKIQDQSVMDKNINIWVNKPEMVDELRPAKETKEAKEIADPTFQDGNFYLYNGFGKKTIDLKSALEESPEELANPKIAHINWDGPISINIVNQQRGFMKTVMVFAVLSIALWIMTFFSTRERVHPPKSQKNNVLKDLKDVVSNGPWWIIGVMSLFTLAQVCIRGSAIMYYFKYYVGNENLGPLLMVIGTLTNLLGVLMTNWLTKVVGSKKRLYIITVSAQIPLLAAFFFLGPDQIFTMLLLTALGGILSGPMSPIVWAMYADIADYSEWRKGTRATGLFFSAATFAQKMGWTFGGAAAGWLLAWYGFQANIVQSSDTIFGIKSLMSWIPAAGCLIAAGLMLFYKLDDKFMQKIVNELEERRATERDADTAAADKAGVPA